MLVVVTLSLLLVQDTAIAPGTLELRDAYRIADQRNPRIAAAGALAAAAQARTGSARRPPDPQVQLGFMNYTVPGWRPMDPIGMTQLQVMQMLPLGGKLGAAGRAADLSAEAESERAQDIRWDVRARVAMAFYDLYATQRSLEIDRATLRLLHEVLRTVESMYRVGEGRQADVLRAQVEIARMTQDTIRMAAMSTAMTARLRAVLNDAPITGSPVLPAFPDSAPALPVLSGTSLTSRPMLRAGQREVEAAEARSSLARKEIWPDLTLGVQYGQRDAGMGLERMGSFMVGFSLPVFAGSRQLRMRDEAAAMERMSLADLSETRAGVDARIGELLAELNRARTLIDLYESTVIPQAEANVESSYSSYRVGSVDFMTLVDARMTVNQYEQEYHELLADYGVGVAELEAVVGRELPSGAGLLAEVR